MIKLLLIRHGRTVWNTAGRFQGQSDIELSPEGIEQAQKLADNFPLDHVDAVYSSSLQRAYKTGELIAEKFNVPIYAEPRLREISFGLWEGLTYDQIHAKWPQQIEQMFDRPDLGTMPEGESFLQVQQRGLEAMDEIIDANDGKVIAITAHGGILRTLLAHVLHMPLRWMWTLRQDNTAVNILACYEKGKFTVEQINGTAHLSITQPPKLGRLS